MQDFPPLEGELPQDLRPSVGFRPKGHEKIQCSTGDEQEKGKCTLEFANLTLVVRQAWGMLSALRPEDKPHGFAFLETHLMGEHLHAAGQRLRKMG